MTYCEACETDGPCGRMDCAVKPKSAMTDLANLRALLEKRPLMLRDESEIMDALPALLDEVEKLRAALRHAIATLERDGDEWGICGDLRQALGSAK